MFLGFTGPNAAGKSEAIKYLVEKKKFIQRSLSDIIRDEAKARGLDVTRNNLVMIGNELRGKEGASVLAKRTVPKIKNAPQAVIDSIRNVSEIEELRLSLQGFKLVGITADIKVRFDRAKKRGRIGDSTTLEEFTKQEATENSADPTAQQLDKCFALADIKLDNSGKVDALYAQIDKMLEDLKYTPYTRPTWDEYFMKMAYLASERSTCLRHHVGAVIVKNNHLISTGYNGAPARTKDCLELGCLRDQLGIASGTRHEVCRAVHAEQNAIIQAAIHGAGTEGATIYCTHSPCTICAKMLVNAKIKRFVTNIAYPDPSYQELFKEAGVEFLVIKRPKMEINILD